MLHTLIHHRLTASRSIEIDSPLLATPPIDSGSPAKLPAIAHARESAVPEAADPSSFQMIGRGRTAARTQTELCSVHATNRDLPADNP